MIFSETIMQKSGVFLKSPPRSQRETEYMKGELSGHLVPWTIEVNDGVYSNYKLVQDNGNEFLIISDKEWGNTLSLFEWWQVRVEGRVNYQHHLFVPERILPTNRGRLDAN